MNEYTSPRHIGSTNKLLEPLSGNQPARVMGYDFEMGGMYGAKFFITFDVLLGLQDPRRIRLNVSPKYKVSVMQAKIVGWATDCHYLKSLDEKSLQRQFEVGHDIRENLSQRNVVLILQLDVREWQGKQLQDVVDIFPFVENEQLSLSDKPPGEPIIDPHDEVRF